MLECERKEGIAMVELLAGCKINSSEPLSAYRLIYYAMKKNEQNIEIVQITKQLSLNYIVLARCLNKQARIVQVKQTQNTNKLSNN